MPPPTKRERFQRMRAELDQVKQSFIPHWRDLGDYILPRRPRFTVIDVNKGERRTKSIIDSTATFAARTLSSGMMAGMTSPARPWKRLTTPDPALAERDAVKAWLHLVNQRMDTVFLRSNLYNALPTVYGDLGVFGTAAMLVEEDPEDVLRCYVFPIGSYALANDERLRVRVAMREFQMTVRQLVERFGKVRDGRPDWSVFSARVRELYDKAQYEVPIDVTHVIAPNLERDYGRDDSRNKPFASCYFETNAQPQDRFLRESGYDEFPVLAPRWEVTGEDVYGTNCPGMTALGDIKQLQLGEKRLAQAIDKIVSPPMVGPPELRAFRSSILPGDMTYVAGRDQKFEPAHTVDAKVLELVNLQEACRFRINRAFFADLFLMLATNPNLDRGQKTAREIEERHEEKLLAVGPVLEQLNQDLLDPLVDRTFALMVRQGMIPEPPQELLGEPLRVEYISIMAQAQKMVGLSSLERFAAFSLQFAEVDPSSLDKIDRDQLIDEYADMTGVPPRVVTPDEVVADIRAKRAQKQDLEREVLALREAAGGAKDLAAANTEQPSVLRDLTRGGAGRGAGVS